MTAAVRDETLALHRQKLPRLFEGGTPFGVFFAVWLAAAVPCAIVLGWQNWIWVAASLVLAIVASALLLAWLRPIARRQSGEQFQKIGQLVADTRQALQVGLDGARARGERESQALIARTG